MPLETLCAILCVVGVVLIFAATLMPARAPQDEHGSPAGSSWTSVSPDVAVRPPWARATSGALVAGQQAETAMRDLLLARLPAGTWVLSGLTLPSLGGDIDLLVVGTLGAVVLEVKYWAGRIVCGPNGHAWTRERRNLIEALRDPARQLESELKALTVFWQRHGWGVASAVGGLLVFAHPRCQLEVAASPVPTARPYRALDILRGCQALPLLSEAEQSRLVALVVAAQPPGWHAGAHVHRASGGAQTAWPIVS